MAGGFAHLFNFQKNCVVIAIDKDFLNVLNVATLFTLHPLFIPGSAIKPSLSSFQCFFPGNLIHISEHQDLPGFGILNNGGNETAHFFKVQLHVGYSIGETPEFKILLIFCQPYNSLWRIDNIAFFANNFNDFGALSFARDAKSISGTIH